MRTIGALVALVCGAVLTMQADSVSGQAAPQNEVAKRFVGAWRYIGTTIDGKPRRDRGASPSGMIYYTASGHMAVQIAPDRERKRAGKEMTPEEAKHALEFYIAYFGTYTIDERAGTVTHHRESSVQPGDAGPLVRAYEFVGDRLILRPPGSTQEITWERIK